MRDYQIIYSRRKSIALQITRDLNVIVRAPFHTSEMTVKTFVSEHQQWLEDTLERCGKSKAYRQYTAFEEQSLRKKAEAILPERIAFYSEQMGVIPNGFKITSAQSRLGSCSGKNNICFSWRLMDYPDEAIDYVVVHELAHIRHKNHSKAFYQYIAEYLPDYKERQRLLKE